MTPNEYFGFCRRAAKLPQIEVTKDEFIRLLVERGDSQAKAEQTAKIAEGLGSYVEIGETMVAIKGKCND